MIILIAVKWEMLILKGITVSTKYQPNKVDKIFLIVIILEATDLHWMTTLQNILSKEEFIE